MSESNCIHGFSDPRFCAHCQGQAAKPQYRENPYSQRTVAFVGLNSYMAYAGSGSQDAIANDRDNTNHWDRGCARQAAYWYYWVHPVSM